MKWAINKRTRTCINRRAPTRAVHLVVHMQNNGGGATAALSIAEKLSKCWQHSFHGPEDALFALAIKRCQIPVHVRKVDGVFRHSTLLKDRSVEEVDVWGNTTR